MFRRRVPTFTSVVHVLRLGQSTPRVSEGCRGLRSSEESVDGF